MVWFSDKKYFMTMCWVCKLTRLAGVLRRSEWSIVTCSLMIVLFVIEATVEVCRRGETQEI